MYGVYNTCTKCTIYVSYREKLATMRNKGGVHCPSWRGCWAGTGSAAPSRSYNTCIVYTIHVYNIQFIRNTYNHLFIVYNTCIWYIVYNTCIEYTIHKRRGRGVHCPSWRGCWAGTRSAVPSQSHNTCTTYTIRLKRIQYMYSVYNTSIAYTIHV